MNNLNAEMSRFGLTEADLANCLGCTVDTIKNKLKGISEFSARDSFKIRDTFFPGMRLEYLFAEYKDHVA